MKSLTIRLPDYLAHQLDQASVARGVSKSDIVRERLSQAAPPVAEASLRAILKQSWEAQVPSTPRRFRSPKKQKLAEIIRAKKLHR